MKGIYKIAVISIVLGLILAVSGITLGAGSSVYVNNKGVHVIKNSKENTKLMSESDLSKITSIDINARSADVMFIESDRYGIEIRYNEIEPVWNLSDGKLKISFDENDSFSFYLLNLNWDSFENNYVKVYMPHSEELDKISVTTSSGDINIGEFNANDIYIKNSSGDINMSNISGSSMDITLLSGKLKGSRLEASNITLKSSSGDADLNDIKAKYLSADVKSGDINIDNCVTDEINLHSSSGDIKALNTTASGMNVKVSSGKIVLDGRFSGLIEITSSSGDVRFTTFEDKNSYNCDLYASSGDITFDNQKYDKKVLIAESHKNTIKIKASSGNINVSFK